MGKKRTKAKIPDVPCALRDVPIGMAARFKTGAWVLVTFHVQGSVAYRVLLLGTKPTSKRWLERLGDVQVESGARSVVAIAEPWRASASIVDAVKDPVAGIATSGPLFEGK